MVCCSQSFLTLTESIDLMHENNISLEITELQREIAKIDYQISRNAIYPTLNLNLNNQYNYGLTFDQVSGRLVTGNNLSKYANGNLTANVILYQGNQRRLTVNYNKKQVEVTEFEKSTLMLELEMQLVELFYQTIINEKLYEASLHHRQNSTKQLEKILAEVENGRKTIIDVEHARSKVENDQMNVNNSKNSFIVSRLELLNLLNFTSDSNVVFILSEGELDYNTGTLREEIGQDPYLQAAKASTELSLITKKLAKSKLFPTISFSSGYGTNYSSERVNLTNGLPLAFWDQIGQNQSFYVLANLTFPIFDGKQSSLSLKKSRLNYQIARLAEQNLIHERRAINEKLGMAILTNREQLKSLDIMLHSSKVNYEAMSERYNVGKASALELFQALSQYNINELNAVISRYELIKNIKIAELMKK